MEPDKIREYNTCVMQVLQGIKCAQRDIRAGRTGAGKDLIGYYNALPEDVARRLTELSAGLVRAGQATAQATDYASVAGDLAGDAAYTQVIRAINVYREKLDLTPLDPEGWPKWEGGHG